MFCSKKFYLPHLPTAFSPMDGYGSLISLRNSSYLSSRMTQHSPSRDPMKAALTVNIRIRAAPAQPEVEKHLWTKRYVAGQVGVPYLKRMARSHGKVVKAYGSQSSGREFEPRHRLPNGCYIDYFPWHVMHRQWVWEGKKTYKIVSKNALKNLIYTIYGLSLFYSKKLESLPTFSTTSVILCL